MVDRNRQSLSPLSHPKTKRNHPVAVVTTMPAGKVVPLAAIPVLREDSFVGAVDVKVEMQETREMLMNGVMLKVTAWAVPWLAFPRFEGSRDQFDNSWNGKPKSLGGPVVPFWDHDPFGDGSNQIFKYLGLHGKATDQINTAYVEAYNLIDIYRATNRSLDLAHRLLTDTTLSNAYWDQGRFNHIVPRFDQAISDGEIALNVLESKMPVHGIGTAVGVSASAARSGQESSGATVNYPKAWGIDGIDTAGRPGVGKLVVKEGATTGYPDIFVEMQQNGITISLANIEVAKKTQAFAKLREQYEGLGDDALIGMLMDGLSIPEQHLLQPMKLFEGNAPFVQAKRYATDSANLDISAVSGAAQLRVTMNLPAVPVGAVIMILAEAVPTQLFERQRDPFMFMTNARDDAGALQDHPAYVRDYMDQEKVDIVFNGDIDSDHDQPTRHFGYEPLNGKWNRNGPRAGGDYLRPEVDGPIDTIRQGIWASEKQNPSLSEDWYRVSSIHLKPFLDEEQDPFRVAVGGNVVLRGNTVFGPVLHETDDNYDALKKYHSPELIEQEG